MSNPKSTTDTDRAVGERITAYRRIAGLSQTALGTAIGVTFQQVQKYEKGQNRVGAGRLVLVAKVLGVSVATLVGQDGEDAPCGDTVRLLAVPGAADLLRSFADLGGDHRGLVSRLAHDLRSAQAKAA